MGNVFEEFKNSALSGIDGLGIEGFENSKPTQVPKSKPTPTQLAAVEASQNKARLGRGVKKNGEDSKLISLNLPVKTIERINELHLKLGRSKQELYEEAFAGLLTKYIDI